MSLENAKRFIEAASKDPALRQSLAAAREPEEVVRLAVAAGSERGLLFTTEEFLEITGAPSSAGSGELSDDELGAVAGGLDTSLSPREQAKRDYIKKLVDEMFRGLDSLPPSQRA